MTQEPIENVTNRFGPFRRLPEHSQMAIAQFAAPRGEIRFLGDRSRASLPAPCVASVTVTRLLPGVPGLVGTRETSMIRLRLSSVLFGLLVFWSPFAISSEIPEAPAIPNGADCLAYSQSLSSFRKSLSRDFKACLPTTNWSDAQVKTSCWGTQSAKCAAFAEQLCSFDRASAEARESCWQAARVNEATETIVKDYVKSSVPGQVQEVGKKSVEDLLPPSVASLKNAAESAEKISTSLEKLKSDPTSAGRYSGVSDQVTEASQSIPGPEIARDVVSESIDSLAEFHKRTLEQLDDMMASDITNDAVDLLAESNSFAARTRADNSLKIPTFSLNVEDAKSDFDQKIRRWDRSSSQLNQIMLQGIRDSWNSSSSTSGSSSSGSYSAKRASQRAHTNSSSCRSRLSYSGDPYSRNAECLDP